MRTYRVREIFYTLQGEGLLSGTPAVFVRFSGCNLWSGWHGHRTRDAERHDARCPLFCDTDFLAGSRLTVDQIVREVSKGDRALPLLVFTGGEPFLQLDTELIFSCRCALPATVFAVETNGTVEPRPGVREMLDHVCVSPKTPVSSLRITTGTELKVVYPASDPSEYADLRGGFQISFVSPEAACDGLDVENMRKAAQYCLDHPSWRLSLQTHKILEIP